MAPEIKSALRLAAHLRKTAPPRASGIAFGAVSVTQSPSGLMWANPQRMGGMFGQEQVIAQAEMLPIEIVKKYLMCLKGPASFTSLTAGVSNRSKPQGTRGCPATPSHGPVT